MARRLVISVALAFLSFGSVSANASNPGAMNLLASSAAFSERVKSIYADFVLVNIWSPSCLACGEEVAELNSALKVANAPAPDRLAILGVPVHARSEETSAFISHFGPSYEQWSPDPKFRQAFKKSNTVPTSLLLNPQRRVIKQWIGKVVSADIINAVNQQPQTRSK